MLAYRLIQQVLKAATGVFFREVHLVGGEVIPDEGERPVLFVGNHPNSLIDPVMLVVTSGRIVHFAAKDKLFAFPLGVILKAMGAVPIARKMDYGDAAKRDNSAAFDAMFGVLAQGRSVGIFPEGLSHDKAQLQRIRSGAARIALDMATREPGAGLMIIPCGLTYIHRKSFRSRVLVQYGEPIEVDSVWSARWQEDQRESAGALTTEIEQALRALTVNAADWETLRVLDGCRRLYQPPRIEMHQRVELARRFCDAYDDVKEEEDVKAIYARVSQFLDALDDAGLDDRDLVRGIDGGRLLGRSVGLFARLAFWLPLALPGAFLHLPLLLGVGWAGLRFAPRKDVIGTSRLMFGMAGVLLAYVAVPVALGVLVSVPSAIVAALMLPISGYATLRVLERGSSLSRLFGGALRSFRLGKTLEALQAERAALEQEVIGVVQRRLPEDMVPLFPHRLQGG